MSETMKVKPWGKDQGDHVIINVADFNPDFHEKFGEKKPETDNEFLKRKAPQIIEDLPACTDDELAKHLADEAASQDRKGVVAAIEKEVASRTAE